MTINTKNVALMTDSYKQGHWAMLRPDRPVTGIYSYLESRTGSKYPYTVFFGLQYLLKEYFAGFVVTQEDVDAADSLCAAHLGPGSFNRAGWERIVNVHKGKLPLLIKAVPEGTPVPVGNVMLTVESTDPELAFLTNFVETQLMRVWYPCNVATISRYTREMLKRYLDVSADNSDGVAFQLHDFGARSATGHETSGIGGMAHLASGALGTDTMEGMLFAMKYYNADPATLAFSVPASEHSIMTQSGPEGEYEILDHLLDTFPTGILSVVADSYDIYEFVRAVGTRKDRIKARKDGVFVVRPDSITKAHPTPALLTAALVEMLNEEFGHVVNTKGYKVLNSVRVLYGDGVDYDEIEEIVRSVVSLGFSSENLVFGQGGHLLQAHTRDTQRNAIKASDMTIGGNHTEVWKRPLDLSKASKRGRLSLIEYDGKLTTISEPNHPDNILETVFENGDMVKTYTFDQVRENAKLTQETLCPSPIM